MIAAMDIREFRPTDLEAVAQMFTASVHGLAAVHYSEQQLLAWAPKPPDLERWAVKVQSQKLLLAVDPGTDELLGFVGFEPDGHVDTVFTSPTCGRRGIATVLHQAAERELAELGVYELFTESSEAARPFFERQGYVVERPETVTIRGVELHRYRMRRPAGHGTR